MQIHASCAAREGAGVLVVGPPGSGKSDLVFRLLYQGFTLVADDQVVIENRIASAPASLAGMIEIRGLGIMGFVHVARAQLELLVCLVPATSIQRLPKPRFDAELGLPALDVDPWQVSAAPRVALALECVLGRVTQHVGAFVS